MAGSDDRRHDEATIAPRARPAWLRALGRDDPPAEVTVDGIVYRREDIFKHDSWAATALYTSASLTSSARQIVCKFNRRQSLLGLPGAWIGRWLGRREADFLRRLADVPYVPRLLGPVFIEGRRAPNAVARIFIEGHPLGLGKRVHDEFFSQLIETLRALHVRNVAYVDLHKRENVLVGPGGRPYLIDFQVSFGLPTGFMGRWRIARFVLRQLQQMDDYNRDKLHRKFRPDQFPGTAAELAASRPWFVRVHRLIAQPLRNARRRLLTWLGVRTGRGKVESERFVETGLREPSKKAA